MTLDEVNRILNSLQPAAKKTTPKKRGKIVGKSRLHKLTIRAGKATDNNFQP